MATSKELREEVRKFLDVEYVEGLRALYGTHGTATHLRDTLLALLDALDAEEKGRQAHDPFSRAWDNPSDAVYDDEGEGNGP